jgi:hypothetical protein
VRIRPSVVVKLEFLLSLQIFRGFIPDVSIRSAAADHTTQLTYGESRSSCTSAISTRAKSYRYVSLSSGPLMSLPKLWPPSLRTAFYTCVAIVGWQVGVGKQPLYMPFERLKVVIFAAAYGLG